MALYVSSGREDDACWVSLSRLGASDFWFSNNADILTRYGTQPRPYYAQR
jgi:hypothetical protein